MVLPCSRRYAVNAAGSPLSMICMPSRSSCSTDLWMGPAALSWSMKPKRRPLKQVYRLPSQPKQQPEQASGCAPMAEVARYDEQRARVVEVRSQRSAVSLLRSRRQRSDDDRHQLERPSGKALLQVRQVHLGAQEQCVSTVTSRCLAACQRTSRLCSASSHAAVAVTNDAPLWRSSAYTALGGERSAQRSAARHAHAPSWSTAMSPSGVR